MATPPWSAKTKPTCRQSCSGFSASPRQLATKIHTLALKKLDGDEKRNRPHYFVRERLFLCSTMAMAEDVLNKRTSRTIRRILDHDDLESHPSDQTPHAQSQAQRAPTSKSDALTAQDKQDSSISVEATQTAAPITHKDVALLVAAASSQRTMIPDPPILRDCRPIMTQNGQSAITGPAVAVII